MYENLKQGKEIQGHFSFNIFERKYLGEGSPLFTFFFETKTNPNINYALGKQSSQDNSASRR